MALHNFAALVGNGLSIPYNANLSVPSLTLSLVNDLSSLSGTPAATALAAFAHTIRGTTPSISSSNFEQLLGPLEAAAAAVPILARLAGVASNAATVQAASHVVTNFATQVHRLGIATVLARIATEAEASLSDMQFNSTVLNWVQAFHALPGTSMTRKTIGTLNYDGLVHAAALASGYQLADLSTGYSFAQHGVIVGQPSLGAHRLRELDDIPNAHIEIVNLHGSLGWLRSAHGDVWKFDIGDLRSQRYWEEFGANNTPWVPAVILTDQKTPAVAERPFSLAYEVFRSRLFSSDRWMIVGYGFGDDPVNGVLATAAALKDPLEHQRLRILCIDYNKPVDALRQHVAKLVGVPETQVLVDVRGIPSATGGVDWNSWAA